MSVAWIGDYSSALFNASKRYRLQHQKGKALCDSELVEAVWDSDSFIRQLVHNNFPRGSSSNNGFKVIESSISNVNNFAITGGDGTVNGAGVLFVDGYILFLKSNIEYNQQDASGSLTDDDYTTSSIPALTTPGGARTDEVYVDFYFAEVAVAGASEYVDATIQVSGVGLPTANRIRQVQDIRVAEGGVTPADAVDVNGIAHRYVKIATLSRLAANNTITTAMITDNRTLINSIGSYRNGSGVLSKIILPNNSDIGDVSHRIANLYMASNIDYSSNLAFASSGTKVTITTGGNVGIGTTLPAEQLQINTTGASIIKLGAGAAASDYGRVNFVGNTAADGTSLGFLGIINKQSGSEISCGEVDFMHDGAAADNKAQARIRLHNGTSLQEYMRIKSDGKIGIGKTNPNTLLDVNGEITTVDLTVNGTTTTINTETTITDKFEIDQDENQQALIVSKTGVGSGNVIEVDNAGTGNLMIMTGNGNVGIGTTLPTAEFEISGTTTRNVAIITTAGTGSSTLSLSHTTGSGQITMAAWSATNPGNYYGFALANTGTIHSTAAGGMSIGLSTDTPIVFGNNNLERMRIHTGGKVGIGTTIPSDELQVYGTTSQKISVTTTAGTGSSSIEFTHTTGSGQIAITAWSATNPGNYYGFALANTGTIHSAAAGGMSIGLSTDAPIVFGNNNLERMRIDTGGKVGIGTTIPSQELQVYGTTSQVIAVTSTLTTGSAMVDVSNTSGTNEFFMASYGATNPGTFFGFSINGSSVLRTTSTVGLLIGASADVPVVFGNNNLERMRINAGGNIGIGTTVPTAEFEISGTTTRNVAIITTAGTGSSTLSLSHTTGSGQITMAAWSATNPGNYYGFALANTGTIHSTAAGGMSIGLSTDTPIVFGNNNLERMRIDTGGKIGIGTTIPTDELQVYGTTSQKIQVTSTLTTGSAMVDVSNTSGTNEFFMASYGATNPGTFFGFSINGSSVLRTTSTVGLLIGASADVPVVFGNNNLERMRIHTGGNIGIGTTIPSQNLVVYKTIYAATDTSNLAASVHASNSAGTNDIGMSSYGPTNPGTFFGFTIANTSVLRTTSTAGLLIGDSADVPVVFGNNNLERMRIDAGGNVGIGTTVPGAALDVVGTAKFSSTVNMPGLGSGAGTYALKWTTSTGLLTYDTSSIRYKKDVVDIKFDTSKIFNLRPVSFVWKSDNTEDFGLIAEEVSEEIKELTIFNKDGLPDGVKYDRLTVILLAELQKMNNKVQELEIRLAALEN